MLYIQQTQKLYQMQKDMMFADVFLTGANGLSLDGQMVNIDGTGNRVAATIYGPKSIIVVAGMNKVEDDLETAIRRARTVAAPMLRPDRMTGTSLPNRVFK